VRWEIKLSLDDKLSQEYSYQKLLKSDNPSRYSRKCRGYFFATQCMLRRVHSDVTKLNWTGIV